MKNYGLQRSIKVQVLMEDSTSSFHYVTASILPSTMQALARSIKVQVFMEDSTSSFHYVTASILSSTIQALMGVII